MHGWNAPVEPVNMLTANRVSVATGEITVSKRFFFNNVLVVLRLDALACICNILQLEPQKFSSF